MQVRVSHSLVSNNRPQFISKAFQQFCTEYGIKNVYSSPQYPQSNGQAEVTSKTLLRYLKKRLTTAKGKRVDELPISLWAYRATPRQPTRETPHTLAFGAEARIPIESVLDPLRSNNPAELLQALEELEEKREQAAIRMAEYQR